MTIPTGDNNFLTNLEAEVEVELTTAESNEQEVSAGPASWLVDPAEAERDEVGLRSLLAAVESLKGNFHDENNPGRAE